MNPRVSQAVILLMNKHFTAGSVRYMCLIDTKPLFTGFLRCVQNFVSHPKAAPFVNGANFSLKIGKSPNIMPNCALQCLTVRTREPKTESDPIAPINQSLVHFNRHPLDWPSDLTLRVTYPVYSTPNGGSGGL